MDNLFFYPTITDQMLQDAGCYCGKYEYSYKIEGLYRPLKPKGKITVRLEDSLESWKIDVDGLRICRQITIEYPKFLKGKNGIACMNAEVGICIIWNNRSLTQMGYIMPESTICNGDKQIYNFRYEFNPGEIKGDLLLDTVLYIKTAADVIDEGEESLMNEAGVTVGIVDSIALDFDSIYMDFPIKDVKEKGQPLWWLELNQWEDPTKDTFTEDYVCLYLNSYYDYCPKVGDAIKNVEILIEILSCAYLMIFQKISEMDYLTRTIDGVDLEPGSISMVMHYFYTSCDPILKVESIDSLQKTIQINIERMLKGGSD